MTTSAAPAPALISDADATLPLLRRVMLTPPPPYDLALTLTALARYPRRVNRWDGTTLRRLFHFPEEYGGAFVSASVWQEGDPENARLHLALRGPTLAPAAALDAAQATLTHMLGAAEDLAPFLARAERDAALGPLVRGLPGLRLFRKGSVTEEVMVDILAQQISLPFAYQCKARLVAAFGPRLHVGHATLSALPEPPVLATLTPEAVRPLLISRQKAAAMRAYGEAVVSGTLDLAALPTMSDAEAITALTRIRGIGPWTAQWTLGRTLARGHLVPLADVGVQAMLGTLTGAGRKLTPDEVRRWADPWDEHALTAVAYVIVAAWRGLL